MPAGAFVAGAELVAGAFVAGVFVAGVFTAGALLVAGAVLVEAAELLEAVFDDVAALFEIGRLSDGVDIGLEIGGVDGEEGAVAARPETML